MTIGSFKHDNTHGKQRIISIWTGDILSIPVGWVLCDGNNGSPDLTDRFIKQTGVIDSIGAFGGQNSKVLTESQLPAHNHTMSTTTDGRHNHSIKSSGADTAGYKWIFDNGGEEAFSGAGGNHTHTATTGSVGGGSSIENRPPFYAVYYIMKVN